MKIIILIMLISTSAHSKITSADLKLDAFIDIYYAQDFNRPANGDRLYTTSSVRHSEFNVNLAYVGVSLNKNKVRGRLAYQVGTSAQANYANEPNRGEISGDAFSRNIQEATIGYRFSEKTVIDAGIYYSPIGFESFISGKSWNYTRSLLLDYVPYYLSGVRVSHEFNEHWSGQIHLVNGWQNIAENNEDKAVVGNLHYKNDSITISYNNFFGKDPRSRFFNDFIVTYNFSPKLQFATSYDVGIQSNSMGKQSHWWASAMWWRYQVTEGQHAAVRMEYYSDPDQLNVQTNTSNGFQTHGASANYDIELEEGVLFRNELRYLTSRDPIFPKSDKLSREDYVYVAALTLLVE